MLLLFFLLSTSTSRVKPRSSVWMSEAWIDASEHIACIVFGLLLKVHFASYMDFGVDGMHK